MRELEWRLKQEVKETLVCMRVEQDMEEAGESRKKAKKEQDVNLNRNHTVVEASLKWPQNYQ